MALLRWWLLGLLPAFLSVGAKPFRIQAPAPTLDRWLYPFGDFDGLRPAAPTWASFDVRFDTRDGQLLLAWDTGAIVPTNAPAGRYWVTRVLVTVEHTPLPSQPSFVYDPTYDSYRTYLTNDIALPDADAGRPVELYGVGYRAGFTALTFQEASPYGVINAINNPTNVSIGTRNAYAADFGDDGVLRDISNNVGQAFEPFEVSPFAVGTAAGLAPGDVVPDGTRFAFDLDLANPLVAGYVQTGLRQGRLPLMLSSLHRARAAAGGIGVGGGIYPNWVTRENLLGNPATLLIEGVFISDVDDDADGLPDDWEMAVFGNLESTGAADADGDGATNREEFFAGTDPRDPRSRLRITGFSAHPGQPARLQFPFVASRAYRVEVLGEAGGWTAVAGTFQYRGTGEALWTAAAPAETTVQFYRVQVQP